MEAKSVVVIGYKFQYLARHFIKNWSQGCIQLYIASELCVLTALLAQYLPKTNYFTQSVTICVIGN